MRNKYDAKALAFYLPQFHPIEENDIWWGKGFTEWNNVAKAKPQFSDHDQPRFPTELGYYDLRIPKIQEQQVELAKEYGIHGFCFYYYWFSGKKLLDMPLSSFMANDNIDFPFSICWANENWTRCWDGSENEALIEQEHSFENSMQFLEDIKPIISHPNYIKVNNKPFLIIYRPEIIPEIKTVLAEWRVKAKSWGLEGLYIGAVNSFGYENEDDGFDSLIEFHPHSIDAAQVNDYVDVASDFSGNVYSYDNVVKNAITRRELWSKDIILHPGVMMGWDNTARRGNAAHIYYGCNPDVFNYWLNDAVAYARKHARDERFVFINAWNEWAEGTYLEPDLKYGRQYLQAVKSALTKSEYHNDLKEDLLIMINNNSDAERLLDELVFLVEARDRVIKYMIGEVAKGKEGMYIVNSAGDVVIDKNTIHYRSPLVLSMGQKLKKYPFLRRIAKKIYHLGGK